MLRCAGQAPQHLRSMIAEGGSMRFVQSGNQKELLWAWSHCSSASPGTNRIFIFWWFHVVSWNKLRWVCYFPRYFGRVSTRKKRMRCCWETCHSTPFGAEKQAWTYTWWGCYGSEIKSLKPWEWVRTYLPADQDQKSRYINATRRSSSQNVKRKSPRKLTCTQTQGNQEPF